MKAMACVEGCDMYIPWMAEIMEATSKDNGSGIGSKGGVAKKAARTSIASKGGVAKNAKENNMTVPKRSKKVEGELAAKKPKKAAAEKAAAKKDGNEDDDGDEEPAEESSWFLQGEETGEGGD